MALGLPLMPLLPCRGMCLVGALVALAFGRKATDRTEANEDPRTVNGRM